MTLTHAQLTSEMFLLSFILVSSYYEIGKASLGQDLLLKSQLTFLLQKRTIYQAFDQKIILLSKKMSANKN